MWCNLPGWGNGYPKGLWFPRSGFNSRSRPAQFFLSLVISFQNLTDNSGILLSNFRKSPFFLR